MSAPTPLPGEAEIREQIRRVLAAVDNYPYEELEPHDYQQQANVIVDTIRPLAVGAGTLRARVTELTAELAEVKEHRAHVMAMAAELRAALTGAVAARDAEIIAWLGKKAREIRATPKCRQESAPDAIDRMASKIARGAVRPETEAGDPS